MQAVLGTLIEQCRTCAGEHDLEAHPLLAPPRDTLLNDCRLPLLQLMRTLAGLRKLQISLVCLRCAAPMLGAERCRCRGAILLLQRQLSLVVEELFFIPLWGAAAAAVGLAVVLLQGWVQALLQGCLRAAAVAAAVAAAAAGPAAREVRSAAVRVCWADNPCAASTLHEAPTTCISSPSVMPRQLTVPMLIARALGSFLT